MSSYHIVQAIWVGVFPMLAAAILVGALCYLLCCLNQIKERIVHSRKKRRLREAARKKALKDKERQQHHHSLSEPIKIDTKLVNVSQSQYKPVKVEAVNLNESLSSTSAYTLATNPNKKNLLLGTVDSQHSTSPNFTRNYNNINSNPSVYNSSNTNNHYYHHHHHHNHHNNQQTPPNLSNLNRPSSFKSVLPNNHNTSLTNKPSLSITTADLEVVDVSDGSEPFNGGKRISMTTTTTTAPLAITDMRKAKRDSTTRRGGGGGGNGEGTETSAESELEQLVVQELNESPKSVYSRLQNLLRRSSNTAKPTDNKSTTTPTTTKIDAFKTTVITTNEKVDIEKQQQQQIEEKKKKESTTSDLDTNNSGAENSTSNTGNEYDENSNDDDDDDNKNASNRERKTSASEKNTGSSKNKRKKQQRFRSSSSNKSKQTSTLEEKSSIDIIQSPNSNTNINTSIDKARLVGLSKSNRLDIDVEDDLIFADDDSLSSTGLCGKGESGSSPPPITSPSTTKPSAMLSSCAPTASCLVAKLQRTSYYQTKRSSTSANQEPNTTTETVSCTKCTGLDVTVVNVSPQTNPEATEEPGKEKSSHHHHHHHHHKSKKTNLNSSLSDIEPDEDMVRNILVKTPPSSTSMPRKHKNNNNNKSDNF